MREELERRGGYEILGQKDIAHRIDLRNKADISEYIAKSAPDIVIHLAGISNVQHNQVDDFYSINVVGTENLLEALYQNCQPSLVILASSSYVYGNVKSSAPVAEETCYAPLNDYAVSKVAMEYVAKIYSGKLPVVVTRPFNCIGKGQSQKYVISKIVEAFNKREKSIELGNLEVRRDFIDIRDVSKVYADLIRIKPAGVTVNICSGKSYSIIEAIEICRKITKNKINVKTSFSLCRQNDIEKITGSVSRLSSLVNISGFRSFDETLNWMLD